MARNRWDAKVVPMPGMMQMCIDLKPNRSENEVYINRDMDVTNLVCYIEEKKAEGIRYTYFQAFLAAIGKVIYNRPKLNRFVSNRHMYEHNDVILSFVAKVALDDHSEELMMTIGIDPADTIETVVAKIHTRVEQLRANAMEKKGANSAIDVLAKLPNPIRVPIMWFFKLIAKKGLLPASLAKDNIYYSSMIVSNLGSIRCGAIYHNLASFGTCSSLASMGEINPVTETAPDGTLTTRQVCDFGITLDERIGDGYYFAKSAKMIEYVLAHPHLLEEPANTPIEMEWL